MNNICKLIATALTANQDNQIDINNCSHSNKLEHRSVCHHCRML